jgi:UDP-N-acetylmuramate dehydrogenase
MVLGGGSNVVISDAGWGGLVIAMAQRGLTIEPRADGTSVLTASAGEPWDELVALSVARGLCGLECLSGIPGLAGATPIQNVGAYGQEVADTITSVKVLDRTTLGVEEWPAERCGFGYRDSVLKRSPDRWVVLEVRFRLRSGAPVAATYSELRDALALRSAVPSALEVRETVLALRRRKSMVIDPGDPNRRSAGSFFTNPVLDAEQSERVIDRVIADGWGGRRADVPRYPQPDGRVKLAAAWLLERAGVRKGDRRGSVGVSDRHALALVHHGGGSSGELVALAREIRDRVRDRFGVELVPEPVFLGFPRGFRF